MIKIAPLGAILIIGVIKIAPLGAIFIIHTYFSLFFSLFLSFF